MRNGWYLLRMVLLSPALWLAAAAFAQMPPLSERAPRHDREAARADAAAERANWLMREEDAAERRHRHRLSPEERRQLRRDVQAAGRDLYADPPVDPLLRQRRAP